MLQPKHITRETCESCGARVHRLCVHDEHVSGEWNEEVTYKCGASFSFSPNLMRVHQDSLCNETKEAKEKKARNDIAYSIKYGELSNGLEDLSLEDLWMIERIINGKGV